MPFPTITTHIPGYEIEIVDVATYRTGPLTEQNTHIAKNVIPHISLTGFTIDREKFDVLDYPSTDTDFPKVGTVLSSEAALIFLKQNGQIVGYNLIVTACVLFEENIFQVNKVGPSSVLPDHRGHHFVDLTTTDFLDERRKEAEELTYIPFSLINAVNEKYKEACNRLLVSAPCSQDEVNTLNRILQASLPGVYPQPVYKDHEDKFTQGAITPSHFAPRPPGQDIGVSSSEPTAEGKLFFIQLTKTVISNTRQFFAKAKHTLATNPHQLFNLDPAALTAALKCLVPFPLSNTERGEASAPTTSPRTLSVSSSAST